MTEKFIHVPVKYITPEEFYPDVLYAGLRLSKEDSMRYWNGILYNYPGTYSHNVPLNDLIFFGYYRKAYYSGYREKHKLYYTFLNPYNNKKTNYVIDYEIYDYVFTEYPIDCITARQVPIIAILFSKKNIPLDVIFLILKFITVEENHKLQKLLEYYMEVAGQKCMNNTSENFLDRKEENALKHPDEWPFEYWKA